jgi:hypothetical protein
MNAITAIRLQAISMKDGPAVSDCDQECLLTCSDSECGKVKCGCGYELDRFNLMKEEKLQRIKRLDQVITNIVVNTGKALQACDS